MRAKDRCPTPRRAESTAGLTKKHQEIILVLVQRCRSRGLQILTSPTLTWSARFIRATVSGFKAPRRFTSRLLSIDRT